MFQFENGSWFQCQWCGHVFQVPQSFSDDTMYRNFYCSKCKETRISLYLGKHKDEEHEFGNSNLNQHIYEY